MNTNDEVASNFIDYAHVIVKHRWTIIKIVAVAVLVTVIITLIMPKTYTASSSILVPETDDDLGLSALTGKIPFAEFTGLGGEPEAAMSLLAILVSRTLNTNTVKEFNLDERWESKYFEDAILELRDKSIYLLEEDGTIVIDVSIKTGWLSSSDDEREASELAANVVNFMVSELDRINKGLKSQWARNNRVFIEKRYKESEDGLVELEKRIRNFMEENGTVALEEQTKAAIEAAAQVKLEIIMSEVELRVLESSLGNLHPDVLRLQNRKKGLEIELNSLKYGVVSPEDSIDITRSLRVYPIFQEIPKLAVMFIRLERELEVQGEIFQFLTQQFEQARIQEIRDTPTLQVLDIGIPRERRSSPQRILTVIMVFVLSLILAIGYAFFRELLEHTTRSDKRSASTLESIKVQIRSDLNYIRKDKNN